MIKVSFEDICNDLFSSSFKKIVLKEDSVPAEFSFRIMKHMTREREIPSSLYWILAVLAGVFLFTFVYVLPSTHIGTCTAAVDDIRRTWTVEGSKNHVDTIILEMIQRKKSDDASVQALALAGNQLQLIQKSRAVRVTFDTSEDEVVVTIHILPSKLISSDYEYLNANHLAVLGTINWKTSGVNEVMAAIQNDGTGASCRLQ